jgi:hypothetical protein
MRSAALFALAIFTATSDAEAKCAMPGVRFEPPEGAVPTSPVLRLFVPPYWAPASPTVTATDATGKKLAATLVMESKSEAFATYRLGLSAAANGTLRVRFVDKTGGDHDAEYTVNSAWKAPAIPSPKIAVTRTQSSWTCSHQLTRNLVFANVAPAYRVTFTVMKNGKDNGSVVLPANTSSMFGAYPTGGNANLSLGYVNCMGSTYGWSTGVFARVEALLPDGSETMIARDVWLDPP